MALVLKENPKLPKKSKSVSEFDAYRPWWGRIGQSLLGGDVV